MSYHVLARKYRPQTFGDMLGQEHIRQALQNSFRQDKIGHAYLFYGPRGVGKTSSARLLAKLLNCQNKQDAEPCNQCNSCLEITAGNCMDVLEIDAASNRGIDNIRNLRENVKFAPVSNPFKIYIIDEVHMLTIESFNALLKTLEEPPAHIKFIFATTEYQKIPATILSRCQEFHFHRVVPEALTGHLAGILKKEDIGFDDESLFWIVEKADGSVRDSLSILDQAIAFGDGKLEAANVRYLLGLNYLETQHRLLLGLLQGKLGEMGTCLKEILQEGSSLKDFLWAFMAYIRSHVYLMEGMSDPHVIGIPPNQMDDFKNRLQLISRGRWHYLLQGIFKLYNDLSRFHSTTGLEEKVYIELGLWQLSEDLRKPTVSELVTTVDTIAERLLNAGSTETPVSAEPAQAQASGSTPGPSAPETPSAVATNAPQVPSKEEAKRVVEANEFTGPATAEAEAGAGSGPAPSGQPGAGGAPGKFDAQEIKSTFMGTDVTDEKKDISL